MNYENENLTSGQPENGAGPEPEAVTPAAPGTQDTPAAQPVNDQEIQSNDTALKDDTTQENTNSLHTNSRPEAIPEASAAQESAGEDVLEQAASATIGEQQPVWDQPQEDRQPDFDQPPYDGGQQDLGQQPPVNGEQQPYEVRPPYQPDGEQSPYGQPLYQAQSPYYQGYEEPAPVKKKSKAPIIIVATVCIILVAIVGIVAITLTSSPGQADYVDVPSRTSDPEGYLNAVTANTLLDLQANTLPLDISRFSGKPGALDFALTLNLQEISSYMPFSEMGISGSFKMGLEQQKILMELAINAGFVSFTDNQLLISPQEIALSIPSIITRYKYVTINPATFNEDYERSSFYSPYSQLPADFDLQEILYSMFEGQSEGATATQDNNNQFQQHFESFQAAGSFQDEGSVTETVNGKSSTVAKLSYTYPAEAVERFYENFLDEYEQVLLTQYQFYGMMGSSYYTPQEMSDMVMEALDAIEFIDDVVIRYTVDENDKVVRVETEKFGFAYYDEYFSREEIYELEFLIDLLGEENPEDHIRASIMVYSDYYNESVEIAVDYRSSSKDELHTRRLALEFIEPYGDSIELSLDFEWSPGVTDDKNMRLTLEGVDNYGDAIGLRITGNLTDDGDAISLTEAQLSVYEDNTRLFNCDFELSYYNIDPSDLDIDTSDSVSFHNLSEADLNSMLGF